MVHPGLNIACELLRGFEDDFIADAVDKGRRTGRESEVCARQSAWRRPRHGGEEAEQPRSFALRGGRAQPRTGLLRRNLVAFSPRYEHPVQTEGGWLQVDGRLMHDIEAEGDTVDDGPGRNRFRQREEHETTVAIAIAGGAGVKKVRAAQIVVRSDLDEGGVGRRIKRHDLGGQVGLQDQGKESGQSRRGGGTTWGQHGRHVSSDWRHAPGTVLMAFAALARSLESPPWL